MLEDLSNLVLDSVLPTFCEDETEQEKFRLQWRGLLLVFSEILQTITKAFKITGP